MTFKLPVICPFCEEEVVYDWSEFIVDQEKYRGEIESTIECDEFECPHRHKMINVFGSVYEAPKGTISDYEITAEPVQE